PEPSSVAVRTTDAEPTYAPLPSCAPLTSCATVGAVVSSPASATTVNVVTDSSDTLPAASVARWTSVCSPGSVTTSGSVYAAQPAPSRSYSTLSTPDASSVAVSVAVADPTNAPLSSCSPATSAVTVGAVVSSSSPATTVNVTVPTSDTLPATSVAR